MAPFASSLRLNVNSILRHMRLQHLIPVCISSFTPAQGPQVRLLQPKGTAHCPPRDISPHCQPCAHAALSPYL